MGVYENLLPGKENASKILKDIKCLLKELEE